MHEGCHSMEYRQDETTNVSLTWRHTHTCINPHTVYSTACEWCQGEREREREKCGERTSEWEERLASSAVRCSTGLYFIGSLRFGRFIYIKTEQRERLHSGIKEERGKNKAGEKSRRLNYKRTKDTLLMFFTSRGDINRDFVRCGQFARLFCLFLAST